MTQFERRMGKWGFVLTGTSRIYGRKDPETHEMLSPGKSRVWTHEDTQVKILEVCLPSRHEWRLLVDNVACYKSSLADCIQSVKATHERMQYKPQSVYSHGQIR